MAGRHRATEDRPSWLASGWRPRHVDTERQPGVRDVDPVPDDDLIPGMRHPDDADGWDR